MALNGKLKRLLPLAFALLMGLAGVFFARQWVGRQRQVLERERKELAIEREKVKAQYQTPIEVVVASKDLPEGTTLEPSHVKMATIPERFVQPYAVRAPKELAGKVAAAPIAEGEQILLNKVRRAEETPAGSTLSSRMPKGRRAVTIAVDSLTGVGGFVRPGDLVDLMWTLKLPPEPGQKDGQVITMTLFQDIPILAVGGDMTGRRATSAASSGESAKESKEPKEFTVTAALTPQETAFLLFAREQGRIQLSLRPLLESGQVSVVPANINTLMQTALGIQAAQQAPPEAKPAPRQVEVYTGLKRGVVSLDRERE